MEAAVSLSPFSRRRVEAMGNVAAYLTSSAPTPARKVAITIHRSLDVHGQVFVNDGSVCVVRRASLLAAAWWAAVATAAQIVMLVGVWPARLISLVVLSVAICSAASAIEAVRQARSFVQPLTHVLSDVVRYRNDRRGSGADLVGSLLDTAGQRRWRLGGTAANATLLQRFYEPLGWVATGDLLFQSPLPVD